MRTITLVTGNKGKLADWQHLLPKDSDITIKTHELDLTEIQSMDSEEIVRDKLRRAYKVLHCPVIVEDVAAGLDSLNGLPGPFFKFFYKEMGPTTLLQLAKKPGEAVTFSCTAGYYDGKKMLIETGVVHGTVVEPRGENGFGFDSVIVPNGYQQTMAEMTSKQKSGLSHRALAVKKLLKALA